MICKEFVAKLGDNVYQSVGLAGGEGRRERTADELGQRFGVALRSEAARV